MERDGEQTKLTELFLQEMYQASVGLQGQINALIKKYSDQKGESLIPQTLERLTMC